MAGMTPDDVWVVLDTLDQSGAGYANPGLAAP